MTNPFGAFGATPPAAPPAPPQGFQAYAQPVPAAAPAQQYAQPAPVQQPAAMGQGASPFVPFGDAAAGGEYPKIDELLGRTLIIKPTNFEMNLPDKFNPGQTRNQVTATVVVLDGLPVGTQVTPFIITDLYLSQRRLTQRLGGIVGHVTVARLIKDGNAFDLAEPSAEMAQVAAAWWTANVGAAPAAPPTHANGGVPF